MKFRVIIIILSLHHILSLYRIMGKIEKKFYIAIYLKNTDE